MAKVIFDEILGRLRDADTDSAHNPNRGTYIDIGKAPSTGQDGDYITILDTSTTPTTGEIYVWDPTVNDNNGGWVPTGLDANDATFQTGQPVIEVSIDNTHLVNAPEGSLPLATDAQLLAQKLRGVTLTETKVNINECTIEESKKFESGVIQNGLTTDAIIEIPVPLGIKKLRFRSLITTSSSGSKSLCFGFFSSNDFTQNPIWYDDVFDEIATSSTYHEYLIEVPDGATYFVAPYKRSGWTSLDTKFYCYLETGESAIQKSDLPTLTNDDGVGDLDIADENNNVIVRFENGHIKTKNFDSSQLDSEVGLSVSDAVGDIDFNIADEQGNVIMELSGGNIKTRNFDSSEAANRISELEESGENIEERVEHLETSSLDAETIIQTTLTRAETMFAPIGHANVSYTPKRTIKILFIGNSVTQDHVGYLPWLLKELYPDEIDFTIGNFYHAGRTLRDYVNDFIVDNNPETGLYSHATNTKTWTKEDNKTLLYAMTQENWDYISIQAYTPRNTVADEAAAALEFVPWLRAKCPSSFELCYLMHQSFGNSSAQQDVRDVANLITMQNPVTVLFAPYFCIKEAQKYWQVDGILSPSGDGTHLKEGIAVMITGMHLMEVLCTKLGLTNKVIKNGLMMTDAIWSTLNVPGPNPPASPHPDDSYATDYNYQNVQICTVQGTKEAEAFYNNSIKSQLETLLS